MYCSSCINMNHCLSCSNAFTLKSLTNGTIICSRSISMTDPNWNITANQCNDGYFLEPNTNTCINCNFEECSVCIGYMNCSRCAAGFYLTQQNSQTESNVYVCAACGSWCMSCSSEAYCNTCNPGYSVQGGICVKCVDPYCYQCEANGNCYSGQCYSYAYWNETIGVCRLCSSQLQHCQTCTYNNNTFNCTSCMTGYYLYTPFNTTSCYPCPKNCLSCGYYDVCSACAQGTFLQFVGFMKTVCQNCSIGCKQCNTLSDCIICYPNYYLISNTTGSFCNLCPFPCLYCYTNSYVQTQTPICGKCYPGFYLNTQDQSNQCLYCNITNCLSCTSSDFCTVCQQGYFTVYSTTDGSQLCSQCPKQCTQCQATNTSATSSFECTHCVPGTSLFDNMCVQCSISNCNYCSTIPFGTNSRIPTCTECATGYMLVANNSQNIPQAPYICKPSSIQNCEVSNLTYIYHMFGNWTVGDPFCVDCFEGFYLSNNSTCSPCSENCLDCSSSVFCLQCAPNYFTIQSNGVQICQPCPTQCMFCNLQGCLTCNVGFYHQLTTYNQQNQTFTCLSCSLMPGCSQCEYQNWCTLCISQGYATYPNTTGQCMACGENCITCDQNLVCSECQAGYQLMVQINQCQNISGIPVWALFSSIILAVMVLCKFLSNLVVIIEKTFRLIRGKDLKESEKKGQQNVLDDETGKNFPLMDISEKEHQEKQ